MIDVTETAEAEIKRLIEAQDLPEKGGLRLFVKGGGCSGLAYGMEIVEGPAEKDKVFDVHGVRVFVDPKSYLFLNGVTMNYTKSLMGQGFIFENPNATGSCGCGTSFSV